MGKIFSIDDFSDKFGISRTILISQLLKKGNHFLDKNEISHKVTWKSEELEKFLDQVRKCRVVTKSVRKLRTRRKHCFEKEFEEN